MGIGLGLALAGAYVAYGYPYGYGYGSPYYAYSDYDDGGCYLVPAASLDETIDGLDATTEAL